MAYSSHAWKRHCSSLWQSRAPYSVGVNPFFRSFRDFFLWNDARKRKMCGNATPWFRFWCLERHYHSELYFATHFGRKCLLLKLTLAIPEEETRYFQFQRRGIARWTQKFQEKVIRSQSFEQLKIIHAVDTWNSEFHSFLTLYGYV